MVERPRMLEKSDELIEPRLLAGNGDPDGWGLMLAWVIIGLQLLSLLIWFFGDF